MDAEATKEFLKDTRKLTAKDRERVDEIINRLVRSEKLGKELHHMHDVFTVRIGNKRLVYQTKEGEGKVLLLFFKSREGVYEYFREG